MSTTKQITNNSRPSGYYGPWPPAKEQMCEGICGKVKYDFELNKKDGLCEPCVRELKARRNTITNGFKFQEQSSKVYSQPKQKVDNRINKFNQTSSDNCVEKGDWCEQRVIEFLREKGHDLIENNASNGGQWQKADQTWRIGPDGKMVYVECKFFTASSLYRRTGKEQVGVGADQMIRLRKQSQQSSYRTFYAIYIGHENQSPFEGEQLYFIDLENLWNNVCHTGKSNSTKNNPSTKKDKEMYFIDLDIIKKYSDSVHCVSLPDNWKIVQSTRTVSGVELRITAPTQTAGKSRDVLFA